MLRRGLWLASAIVAFIFGTLAGADAMPDFLNSGLVDLSCFCELCRAPSAWNLALLGLFSETSRTWNPVDSTDEAAYAVDRNGVIVAWNAAAERTFGFKADAAVGRNCWDLLGGHDIFDNRYCGPDCPIREMACRRESIHGSRLQLRTSSSCLGTFDVSILEVSGDTDAPVLVHVCRPVITQATIGETEGFTPSPNRQRGGLTRREVEVLRLIAEGKATSEIASDMCVSIVTVRNHVQRILYKLRVHSRVAGVAKARRLGLI